MVTQSEPLLSFSFRWILIAIRDGSLYHDDGITVVSDPTPNWSMKYYKHRYVRQTVTLFIKKTKMLFYI